ncbi:hypothetical protein J4461_03270 [Candidatus Pacearchaeota archaeon]|nr:hypothetical protein [Candidatus Pacearchaeota archaeon]
MEIKIGMDLDEVIADFVRTFLRFYNERYNKKVDYNDIRTYNFWENGVGENKKDSIRLVDEFHDSEYFDKIGLVEGTREFIYKIHSQEIIPIITARPHKYSIKTEDFLTRNLPRGTFEVLYSGDFHGVRKNKADLCNETGVTHYFEDNLKYALEIAQRGITVLLPNRPWNQGETSRNVLRIKSWNEAYKILAISGRNYGY